MPLLYVQRYAQVISSDGVQTVDGTLSFTGPTVIELDPTVYNAPGLYVLFTYGTFAGSLSNVTIDATALIPPRAYAAGSLYDDTANSRITIQVN